MDRETDLKTYLILIWLVICLIQNSMILD